MRKSDINIFEVNSDHKILCTTEKINENNYRCLFMIINNNKENKNKKLIIYSFSKSNFIKLNISADYINKDEYDNWNADSLSKSIPNINSNFSNYNKEMDFIIIPNLEIDKYIYISIESKNETTIEMINKIINDDKFVIPKINDIQIYSIKENSIELDLYTFSQYEFSLSLVTLCGKGNISLNYEISTTLLTDSINNKLIIDIERFYCKDYRNCKLIINKLNKDDEKEIDFLFYIHITQNNEKNILRELTYGKSSTLCRSRYKENPIILYEQIKNIDSPININLKLYNSKKTILLKYYNIEVRIFSKTQIYETKLNYKNIFNFRAIAKGNFDYILAASNIYLNIKDISNIIIPEEPYLVISISFYLLPFGPIILGSTISQTKSLISPSERIYHYGQLNKEEKIVYRLKGNSKYHLMRLEFGYNSIYIGWSVKRNINDTSYMNNDTDLSFVTEKWSNGRALLTMYIERGEDIYLTIFQKEKIKNVNLTNYIFKYINAAKNSDFKNYLIKNDRINYDDEEEIIRVNSLKNIPDNLNIQYYLKMIYEDDCIKDEITNSIAITSSYYFLIFEGLIYNDFIEFNIKDQIKNYNYNYSLSVFSIIAENTNDIEYLSYSKIKITNNKIKKPNKILIILSIVFASIFSVIHVGRLIVFCYK